MKNFLILIVGFLIGTSFSWPGAISIKGWRCFFDVIEKVSKEEMLVHAAIDKAKRFLLKQP